MELVQLCQLGLCSVRW